MNKHIKDLIKNDPELADYISDLYTGFNDEIQTLKQQLEAVKFTLSKMNRTVFGTSSEKTIKETEEERNLFNLNEAENNQNLNAIEPTISKVIKKRKTKTTKAESFKNFESRVTVYDLDDTDKTCHDCDVPLVEVGSKTRETIEIIKKAVKVMEKSITYKVCRAWN